MNCLESFDFRKLSKTKDDLFRLVLGENREIPERMPKVSDFDTLEYDTISFNSYMSFVCRSKYISECGFVFLSWNWITPFIQWINGRKCLEIMSGTGALSSVLRSEGVDIIATDNFSWKDKLTSQWMYIEDLDSIAAIDIYGKSVDIVIMSWAPYGSDLGYECLKRLYEVNPKAVMVVIGEDCYGCTASGKFFDYIEVIEDDYFDSQVMRNYETWYSIHDFPMIVRYKTL